MNTPTHYHPADIEASWYQYWEAHGLFQPKAEGQPYGMVIPPPNITGSLHMGHAFQYTLMDALIRYHRMQGYNTLWQVGTDHAGIATQLLVEQQLTAKHIDRKTLGREQFIQAVWAWKKTAEQRITQQIRRLGAATDWSRQRFTMDPGLSAAVQQVFITLYREQLIYRGKKMVNWDPHFKTAISDLEVITEEVQGTLWSIRYRAVHGSAYLVVATTRPETLFGDVAIAVHPEDERYQHWIGQSVYVPICQRVIPVIADDTVLPNFGTGCVKITPAHDFNDYEVGQRHQLPIINILTPEAKLNTNVPTSYQGLDRLEARQRLLQELTAQSLLVHAQPYLLSLPRGDRSGAVIEPYLTDQWFVHMKPLAEPALKAVEERRIRFVPQAWTKTYQQWLNHIEDWCISRQLWWGHRIPAWYDPDGQIYVGSDLASIYTHYGLDPATPLVQDESVLDTWFSSALWPFSSLDWPDKSAIFNTFYPTHVLVTGFDIIFFWVARMIMFALKFTDTIPFHTVYITGLIRDAHGQKMSKSKGNVLDPLDLIDGITADALVKKRTEHLLQSHLATTIERQTRKEFPHGIEAHSCDALRLTFATLATQNREINFDFKRLSRHKHFCNKLWHMVQFTYLQTNDQVNHLIPDGDKPAPNLWIEILMNQTINQAHQYFQTYRFDHLAQMLHDFIWHQLCDWYIELTKVIFKEEAFSPEQKQNTRYTLLSTVETTLRLLHPLIPHITEALWQQISPLLGKSGPSIMAESYPQAKPLPAIPKVEEDIKWLQDFITTIRNLKSEIQLSPNQAITLYIQQWDLSDQHKAKHYQAYLQALAGISKIQWVDEHEALSLTDTAATACGHLKIYVPLADLTSPQAEIERLHKRLKKVNQLYQKLDYKLHQTQFKQKAQPEIIAEEIKKFAILTKEQQALLEQLTRLENNSVSS